VPLRECVAAGEPLNPEVIEQVRAAWGITVRDGYGQTETTAQIGNPPGDVAIVKAYVMLADGVEPGPDVAFEILRFCRGRLAPYQRVRRIELAELPKTISGKIRRVELRDQETARAVRGQHEYWEEDFPELKSTT
jgi:acyl-coenzyme A synthetase/AMP-(fatty) acid ligase